MSHLNFTPSLIRVLLLKHLNKVIPVDLKSEVDLASSGHKYDTKLIKSFKFKRHRVSHWKRYVQNSQAGFFTTPRRNGEITLNCFKRKFCISCTMYKRKKMFGVFSPYYCSHKEVIRATWTLMPKSHFDIAVVVSSQKLIEFQL